MAARKSEDPVEFTDDERDKYDEIIDQEMGRLQKRINVSDSLLFQCKARQFLTWLEYEELRGIGIQEKRKMDFVEKLPDKLDNLHILVEILKHRDVGQASVAKIFEDILLQVRSARPDKCATPPGQSQGSRPTNCDESEATEAQQGGRSTGISAAADLNVKGDLTSRIGSDNVSNVKYQSKSIVINNHYSSPPSENSNK